MSLVSTNLFIQMAQLPVTFKGSPQDLSVEMVKRMRIVSPNGVNFIFIGDVAPTSNVGPWLRGGTQWWVWDTATNQYVPLDLSASFTTPFAIGNSTPSATNPPVWLRTTQDRSDVNPTAVGEPLGWFVFDGVSWVPFNSLVNSGGTAGRPSNPVNLQQYFDSDIGTLIWFEGGNWKTVDGVRGDLKFVTAATAAAALLPNPGWAIAVSQFPQFAGLTPVTATSDPGLAPAFTVAPAAGAAAQPQGAVVGTGPQLLQINPLSALAYTPTIALHLLVKL
jgi:hypothetical protein